MPSPNEAPKEEAPWVQAVRAAIGEKCDRLQEAMVALARLESEHKVPVPELDIEQLQVVSPCVQSGGAGTALTAALRLGAEEPSEEYRLAREVALGQVPAEAVRDRVRQIARRSMARFQGGVEGEDGGEEEVTSLEDAVETLDAVLSSSLDASLADADAAGCAAALKTGCWFIQQAEFAAETAVLLDARSEEVARQRLASIGLEPSAALASESTQSPSDPEGAGSDAARDAAAPPKSQPDMMDAFAGLLQDGGDDTETAGASESKTGDGAGTHEGKEGSIVHEVPGGAGADAEHGTNTGGDHGLLGSLAVWITWLERTGAASKAILQLLGRVHSGEPAAIALLTLASSSEQVSHAIAAVCCRGCLAARMLQALLGSGVATTSSSPGASGGLAIEPHARCPKDVSDRVDRFLG